MFREGDRGRGCPLGIVDVHTPSQPSRRTARM